MEIFQIGARIDIRDTWIEYTRFRFFSHRFTCCPNVSKANFFPRNEQRFTRVVVEFRKGFASLPRKRNGTFRVRNNAINEIWIAVVDETNRARRE